MKRTRTAFEYLGNVAKLVFKGNRNKQGSLEFDGDSMNLKINNASILEADASGAAITGTLSTDTVAEATSAAGVTIDGVKIKDGSIVSALSPVVGFPVWNGVDPSDWITYIDDFITIPVDNTTGFPTAWTMDTDTATGTGGVIDQLGGWMNVSATNTDNFGTTLSTIGESFHFDTDKKFILKCRVQLTEGNTDDANWAVGVSTVATKDFLQNDGAGPAATYDGAVFFKVDGTMQIQFETSNAGTQVTTATGLSTFVSATTYNLAFVYDYADGTTGSITPYVNGVAGTAHAITIAGLETMHFIMSVKTGDTNAEAFLVDYIAIAQERR